MDWLFTWTWQGLVVAFAAGVFGLASLDPVVVEASAPVVAAVEPAPANAHERVSEQATSPSGVATGELSRMPANVEPGQLADTLRTPDVPPEAPAAGATRSPSETSVDSGRIVAPSGSWLAPDVVLESVPDSRGRDWPEVGSSLTSPIDGSIGDAPSDDRGDRRTGTTRAGARIGAGARKAAAATSGFVTRFAKSVARAF